MDRIERYVYINDLGRRKSLTVNWDKQEEDKYFCLLHDLITGEECGSTYKTKAGIVNFLAYYGVKI